MVNVWKSVLKDSNKKTRLVFQVSSKWDSFANWITEFIGLENNLWKKLFHP